MSTTATKIALVTEANKGIGFEVAREIGRTGATILVGARDEKAGQEAVVKLTAEGIHAQFIRIDLTDRAAIQAAAQSVDDQFGRLDILVNNAGIFLGKDDGPPSAISIATMETTFRTNFFGAVAVTQAMLPLLRKATSARIVNVSSGLGSLTLNGDPNHPYSKAKSLGYNASKAALNMLTVQLADELRDTPIKVNSADPGYTATDLNGHSGPQTIPEGAVEVVQLALLPDSGPTGTFSNKKGTVPW
jgi:NAD(P)-dependent dehydrogenase (short-subunit alcohol dehydrogenase family)